VPLAEVDREVGVASDDGLMIARRCHSDAGSQFTSLRYGERLAEIGAVPSIGTVGDSFDDALAETVNGNYKAGLIRGPSRPGPWPGAPSPMSRSCATWATLRPSSSRSRTLRRNSGG